MKLVRLNLENWRGVESFEVQFADGVTLIEGPNEIGKSTIVEALQALFKTMDSSSKAEIKAIQIQQAHWRTETRHRSTNRQTIR